jgi:hypothetical protein
MKPTCYATLRVSVRIAHHRHNGGPLLLGQAELELRDTRVDMDADTVGVEIPMGRAINESPGLPDSVIVDS